MKGRSDLLAEDYKEFIHTHKNNFWNNLRLGKKGREWADEYTDELCENQVDCPGCPAERWCNSNDGTWFSWTHPCFVISSMIGNHFDFFLWRYWFEKHPGKKIHTCSYCGLKKRGSKHFLITYSGWRYKDHKWICHHCLDHPNDDCVRRNGEFIPISHEEYEQNWKSFVEQFNKRLEENHNGT